VHNVQERDCIALVLSHFCRKSVKNWMPKEFFVQPIYMYMSIQAQKMLH